MSCKSFYLKSKIDKSLEDISQYLIQNVDSENPLTFHVLNEIKQYNEIKILNFVFEKSYRRIQSNLFLNIQILEDDGDQFVQMICFTESLFDLGAIDHFVNQVILIFKELGFEEV